MRLAPFLLTVSLLLSPGSARALSDNLARVETALFAGVQGAVTGDTNADGLATAPDLTATLLGARNPNWMGPYRIGTTVMTFTKSSVTSGEPRVLETPIWYPTRDDGPPNLYRGLRDATVAPDGGPFPLLVFSHGSCGIPTQSLFLTPLLASYGFIVAAPPHPGNRLTDGVPACGAPAALGDSFQNRLPDVMFIIDEMLAESADAESLFSGAVDSTRIGISGHSFGGQTALRTAAADDRVIASLALAPAAVPNVPSMIQIPTMIQGSELDTVTPFQANQQIPFDELSPPRYLTKILNTGHYAYSDNCFPSPDCGRDRLTQSEAHTYVVRYAVPFLLSWLAGDRSFDAFLDPAATPPGVVFTADPGPMAPPS